MNTSTYSSWLSLIYGVGSFVTFATLIATIVVVTGVVRRNRPDAYKPLLTWSIVALAIWAVSMLLSIASRSIVQLADGLDLFYKVQIADSLLAIPLHLVAVFLLLRGLVIIAQPPKPVDLPTNAPYR